MTKGLDKIIVEAAEQSADKAPEVQPASRRPARRTPVTGPRAVLRASKEIPGFKLRVVNDVGDRVEYMKEKGYVVVTDQSIRLGDRRAGKAGSVGTPVEVSVGQGTKAVLMAQRDEWYEEDQQIKQEQVDSDEESMYQRAKTEHSDYGSIKREKK